MLFYNQTCLNHQSRSRLNGTILHTQRWYYESVKYRLCVDYEKPYYTNINQESFFAIETEQISATETNDSFIVGRVSLLSLHVIVFCVPSSVLTRAVCCEKTYFG